MWTWLVRLTSVDLRLIKSAARGDLAACARAAVRNAQGLLRDAEVLSSSGSKARAYSLAALAVEECGKAASLTCLALLPRTARTRTAVGRLVGWHQLKLIGGLLITAVTFDGPGLAPKLARMPASQVAQVVDILAVPADEADRLRQRGLYVDMDAGGRIREPSEIAEADLAAQLARAQQAVMSAGFLLSPEAQARIANPSVEAIRLARALVDVLSEAGYGHTPEDAADVMLNAVTRLHHKKPADPAAS
jgi:AbiV family abortive infection protein